MTINKVILCSLCLINVYSCQTMKILRPDETDTKTYREFKYLASQRPGNIECRSGETVKTEYLIIQDDSLRYRCPGCNSDKAMALVDAKEISFTDHFIGGFEGTLWGVFGGLMMVLIVDPDSDVTGLEPAFTIAATTFFGTVGGALIGHKIHYKLQNVVYKIEKD